MVVALECLECGEIFDDNIDGKCPICGGVIEDVLELHCLECGQIFEGVLEECCPYCNSENIEEI